VFTGYSVGGRFLAEDDNPNEDFDEQSKTTFCNVLHVAGVFVGD
jgi:hypothetical protein